ncbi:peptide ABC transporter ATP-binding protein [Acidihalobacter yilgarnensis]|uniref:Peptide ABC transporter ATP-binding protein n=1 Tax=Acidihalobacter yilgarnensis TaxID=2819280 RepID=A0A1D8INT9_9GAMM|nr:dipeptide ABC transporter ATP-binding protein [Acidihalobacter yilgarnensis]AOU98143.1 peptide ABC transporter ATP-binding protein [Acidihalobacter yilgarnensis]
MSTAIVEAPLLEARGLSKFFDGGRSGLLGQTRRRVIAVDGVWLQVYPGETLGLVGESGCGKSTLGRCLVRLQEPSEGELWFEGNKISHQSMRELRPLRPRLQMVFQDPSTSLNPRRRIGDLIAEPLRVHTRQSRAEITERVGELLQVVGLQPEHFHRFPHEFSGGQRQRIGIARALALNPRLVVADEPVSALDVSIQAQIVNLFADLQEQFGLTYVFIAHDLSVVRQVSTRTAVMYLGAIAEIGPTKAVYREPAHPYTQALISAVPVPELDSERRKRRILLKGDLPSPMNPPSGCRFQTRCPQAQALCRQERPQLKAFGDGRSVACHFPLV